MKILPNSLIRQSEKELTFFVHQSVPKPPKASKINASNYLDNSIR